MPEHEIEDFPTSFPMQCVLDAVRMVQNGEVLVKKRTFGLHVYNVAGYGLGQVLQDGPNVFGAQSAKTMTDDEVFATVAEYEATAQATDANAQALPAWATPVVMWLVQKLFELLTKQS